MTTGYDPTPYHQSYPQADVLYHYCGVQSFLSILSSRSLHLASLHHMNDYLEHKWLTRLSAESIAELSQEHSHPFYKKLVGPLESHVQMFVACFSAAGDLLSQWRAYADDGAGFAIGFNTAYFEKLLTLHNQRNGERTITIAKVEYDLACQEEEVRRLIEYHRHTADSEEEDEHFDRAWHYNSQALDCHIDLWHYAAECKNPAFREEDEWRIINTPCITYDSFDQTPRYSGHVSDIAFRVSRNDIVPYCVLRFDPQELEGMSPISEVVLGPKNRARQRHDATRMLLAHCGYGDEVIRIRESEASYQ
jgi:hypothetical protein